MCGFNREKPHKAKNDEKIYCIDQSWNTKRTGLPYEFLYRYLFHSSFIYCRSCNLVSCVSGTNFCIGIFSTVLLFIVEVAIWSAVYQGKEEVGSISYNSIMIYTVMTLLLQRLLGGGTDEEIGNDFQSGNIVTSLLRKWEVFLTTVS